MKKKTTESSGNVLVDIWFEQTKADGKRQAA
jgi:hypothetical protein